MPTEGENLLSFKSEIECYCEYLLGKEFGISVEIAARVELLNHVFKIDLLPTRLGSFDVIVGMDWLAHHHASIICDERIVRIPLPDGHVLDIYGERPDVYPKSLLCIKADEKVLDDIHVVREFPEVFPDDLSGLPPIREV
ncbi:putative reverse transcriptase domain-containing protein, partial [Tanacetum coccineum]